MDWNSCISLAFFKVRLDDIARKDVFTDLGDLDYLEKLEREYNDTWRSLEANGVLPGEPCAFLEGQGRELLGFLREVHETYSGHREGILQEETRFNSQDLGQLEQSRDLAVQLNTSHDQGLGASLGQLSRSLASKAWKHHGLISNLLAFEREAAEIYGRELPEAPLASQSGDGMCLAGFDGSSLASLGGEGIESLLAFVRGEGALYADLEDLMKARVAAIDGLIQKHGQDREALERGLESAGQGYFGSAYIQYLSISGEFYDVDYRGLEAQLADYMCALENLKRINRIFSDIKDRIGELSFWPAPFLLPREFRKFKGLIDQNEGFIQECREIMDPHGHGDIQMCGGGVEMEEATSLLGDCRSTLKEKAGAFRKQTVIVSAIALVCGFAGLWVWDSNRMEGLQKHYPERGRFESDADYAARMQDQYPGIKSGQSVPVYRMILGKMQKQYPGRKGGESDEGYAARMQEEYPGLKPGEVVSAYISSMEELEMNFPGRGREESDAAYAQRMQGQYPGLEPGEPVADFVEAVEGLQEDFPGRRGDEDDGAYAERMQSQYPGLKAGESVSAYLAQMKSLTKDFPGRLRSEDDPAYAARMQGQYPGLRAGESIPAYTAFMTHLHKGFPGRGREESAPDYATRMQGKYPGILSGQTVADYEAAVAELAEKFPGRIPGESDGSYAQRMQTQFPGLMPGETPLEYKIRSGMPFSVPGLGLEMVPVPAGKSFMGSPPDEPFRGLDENRHMITISKGFWMGKFEVTQNQWQQIMGSSLEEQGKKAGRYNTASYLLGSGERFPMTYVNWLDARDFCLSLNKHEKAGGRLPTGLGYQLPTEAQWEYACRAGTESAFSLGSNVRDKINLGRKTLEVGSFGANAWGLHDMHGNVLEWCRDGYRKYGQHVADPQGNSYGYRAVRGGSFNDELGDCRSAKRKWESDERRHFSIGFRICLSR